MFPSCLSQQSSSGPVFPQRPTLDIGQFLPLLVAGGGKATLGKPALFFPLEPFETLLSILGKEVSPENSFYVSP